MTDGGNGRDEISTRRPPEQTGSYPIFVIDTIIQPTPEGQVRSLQRAVNIETGEMSYTGSAQVPVRDPASGKQGLVPVNFPIEIPEVIMKGIMEKTEDPVEIESLRLRWCFINMGKEFKRVQAKATKMAQKRAFGSGIIVPSAGGKPVKMRRQPSQGMLKAMAEQKRQMGMK